MIHRNTEEIKKAIADSLDKGVSIKVYPFLPSCGTIEAVFKLGEYFIHFYRGYRSTNEGFKALKIGNERYWYVSDNEGLYEDSHLESIEDDLFLREFENNLVFKMNEVLNEGE